MYKAFDNAAPRKLYCVPQRSAQQKPFYAAMGKVKEILTTIYGSAMPKPTWTIEFNWQPSWNIKIVDGECKHHLATLSPNCQWTWTSKNLKDYLKVQEQDIYNRM